MVFDPDVAPAYGIGIQEWYGEQMEAGETDADLASTFEPSTTSDRLRAFYDEMRKTFRAMNRPDADVTGDVDFVAGYAFYPGFIYMDFRWSGSEAASELVLALARKHRIGLFDPQDAEDGFVWSGTPSPKPGQSWWARWFK